MCTTDRYDTMTTQHAVTSVALSWTYCHRRWKYRNWHSAYSMQGQQGSFWSLLGKTPFCMTGNIRVIEERNKFITFLRIPVKRSKSIVLLVLFPAYNTTAEFTFPGEVMANPVFRSCYLPCTSRLVYDIVLYTAKCSLRNWDLFRR
jgi:hypothetical protein